MDLQGNLLVPCDYGFIESLQAMEDHQLVLVQAEKIDLIEDEGTTYQQHNIQYLWHDLQTEEPRSLVEGKVVRTIEMLNEERIPFSTSSFAYVHENEMETELAEERRSWGVADLQGNLIVPQSYDYISGYLDGKAFGFLGDENRKILSADVIDRNGNTLFSRNDIVNPLQGYHDGLALVILRGDRLNEYAYGMLDENGNTLFTFPADQMKLIGWDAEHQVLCFTKKDGGSVVYDNQGRIKLETADKITHLQEGYLIFENENGNWGAFRSDGTLQCWFPEDCCWLDTYSSLFRE